MPLVRVNQDEAAGVTFLPGLDSIDAGDMADAEAALNASVTVADPVLNRVGVTASVPLTLHGGVPNGTPKVGIVVSGLRLPGSSQPVDIALDSSSDLGPELKHVLIALLQAEAGSATGAAHDLLGMNIGPLPAGGSIPTTAGRRHPRARHPGAAAWVESIVTTPAAMQALQIPAVADLVGGDPRLRVEPTVRSRHQRRRGGPRPHRERDRGLCRWARVTPGVLLRETPRLPDSGGPRRRRGRPGPDRLGLHPGRARRCRTRAARRPGTARDSGTILSDTAEPADISVGALHVGVGLDATRKPVFGSSAPNGSTSAGRAGRPVIMYVARPRHVGPTRLGRCR